MKIGEVAKRTGLTEKAIRVYVDNGLVTPNVEQTTHRNSYDFTEEHVRELARISIFRKAGFSIFEISVIQREPQRLPELIRSKQDSLAIEVEFRERVQEAFKRLSTEEMGNPNRLAEALRPAVEERKVTTDKGSRRGFFIVLSILGIVGTVLWLHYIGFPGRGGIGFYKLSWPMLGFVGGLLMLWASMFPGIMSIRYGTCTRRAAKMKGQAVGSVIAVLEEHGFDGRFARAGMGSAGTREPGIGGSWQWRFMIWNEIRFDCWFPMYHYTNSDGQIQSASCPYGAFRDDYKVGDRVALGYDPREPWYVFPLEGKWLTKKMVIYAIVALVMIAVGAALVAVSGPMILTV